MATNATIEKVVRQVIDEELGETKQATLKAIRQVSRLLTEQVIPHLPDADDDQDENEPEEETPVSGSGRSQAFGARTGKPGSGRPTDNPGIPEEDEHEPPTSDVPTAVTEALEDVYNSLSAEQAKALAAMFTAISREPGSEGEEAEEEDAEEEEVEDGMEEVA